MVEQIQQPNESEDAKSPPPPKRRKSTALISAATVSVISLSGLLTMAATRWPFPQIPEDCYQNYMTEEKCFCERPRGDEPGDVWFAQPANASSNLTYAPPNT